VDQEVGTPSRYHLASDSPDNLDYDKLVDSIDFVEEFVHAVVAPADREARPQALQPTDSQD
jgi:hypothetical protein